ncbi:hypothetical protein [Streptomyces sp. NPDC050255]|uniref:hypothetical protein n=1 Tax=Streptomyces sp. NPDC050255 TaxID=3365606 RepID=UPI0037A2C085
MTTRQVACWIAVCDLCGGTTDPEGFTAHFDTPADAIGHATAWNDRISGWTITPDGRLVCDTVTDRAHETVHEAAGKRIPEPGPDAMHVTFTTA